MLDQAISWMCRVWRRACEPKAVYWLAALVFFWLAFLAWMRPLHIPDEGRYVGVAWDMVRFDSTWTPLLNGLPYFHKPPLFYWLNEFSFILFGAHEWAARAPSLIIAWITAMALFLFVRRHRGSETAVMSLLVLVTMPYFFGAAQYANLDMMVAGMICLTIMAGAEAVSRIYQNEPHALRFAVATGALAALAVLSKGLIGVVLPGGVLFFWLLLTRRWRGFGLLLAWPVWVAFAVVGVPWFVAMELEHSGFLHYFFVYQHFERYLSAGFNQQQPVWFFLPVIFGFAAPWSVWLVRYVWQRGPMQFDLSWHGLMVLWMVVITVFFSIPSSKLIGYVVPVLPAMAVLVAEVMISTWKGLHERRDLRLSAITAGGAVAMCIGALIGFMFANDHSTKSAVKAMSAQIAPDDRFVMLDIYPFDLAFYTGSAYQTWVVFPWPNLPAGDTWRNELDEAGRFAPHLTADALIEPGNLVARMCQGPDRTYWFGGYPHEAARWPWLASRDKFYEKRNGETFWKVPVDAQFREQWCEEAESAKS